MYHDMDMNGWWALWGALMMLIFWGGVIFAIVWAARSFGLGARRDSPLDIARERYARGEITREEFESIRRGLAA